MDCEKREPVRISASSSRPGALRGLRVHPKSGTKQIFNVILGVCPEALAASEVRIWHVDHREAAQQGPAPQFEPVNSGKNVRCSRFGLPRPAPLPREHDDSSEHEHLTSVALPEARQQAHMDWVGRALSAHAF